MKGLIHAALDLLYPSVCALCGRAGEPAHRHLCWDCAAGLPRVERPFCDRCGDPAEGRIDHTYQCAWCTDRPPAYRRARSALRYRGAVRDLLRVLKYNGGTHLAHDFAVILQACATAEFHDPRWDIVLPVPLHARKLRHRTYNQAALLASALAERIGVAYRPAVLFRVRDPGSQTRLNSEERRRNVRGCFRTGDVAGIEGRRVLLVDDVMTTGATVDEAARELCAAGAESVEVLTVARG